MATGTQATLDDLLQHLYEVRVATPFVATNLARQISVEQRADAVAIIRALRPIAQDLSACLEEVRGTHHPRGFIQPLSQRLLSRPLGCSALLNYPWPRRSTEVRPVPSLDRAFVVAAQSHHGHIEALRQSINAQRATASGGLRIPSEAEILRFVSAATTFCRDTLHGGYTLHQEKHVEIEELFRDAFDLAAPPLPRNQAPSPCHRHEGFGLGDFFR